MAYTRTAYDVLKYEFQGRYFPIGPFKDMPEEKMDEYVDALNRGDREPSHGEMLRSVHPPYPIAVFRNMLPQPVQQL